MAPQSRECSTKLRGSSALATLTSKSRSELRFNKLTLANAGVLVSARDTGGSTDWYNICHGQQCRVYTILFRGRVAQRSGARTGPHHGHASPQRLPHRHSPPLTFIEKPFQVCEDATEIWQTGHELLLV